MHPITPVEKAVREGELLADLRQRLVAAGGKVTV
jgi:hypothetical protein